MALYNSTRRILGPIITSFRTLCTTNSRQVRTFKGVRSMKYNPSIRTRRQPVRYRKGNYRSISQSSLTLAGCCAHLKSSPAMRYHDRMDIFRLNGGYIAPLPKYFRYPGMANKAVGPMAGSRRWYAQAKEPSVPAGKGGPVSSSGGRLGRLDAANESGFFHKVNKSRLEQIKQMLREKAMLKEKDEKRDPNDLK